MKVLVTGANGFLGKFLCKKLLEEGYQVAGLVQRKPELTNIQIKFFINQLPNLSVKMIKKWSPDAIVHCAFETNFQNAKKSYSTNIIGSKKVIKLAREINSYFLFISSMSSHKQALSTYGIHKLLVEKELDLSRDGIISPGLIIGEGGIFLQTIKIIKSMPFIPLFFGGKQKIQTANVEDVVEAIILMIKTKFKGKVMFGESCSLLLRDFYRLIAISLNKKPIFIRLPGNIILLLIKSMEKLNLKLPLSSDNLYGIKKLKDFQVDEDLERLGVFPLSAQDSIDSFPWKKYFK